MFYDIYAQICRENGISPTGAAKAMGIGSATVSHWKNRGLSPRAEQMQKIAEYFNVSVDYLLGKEKAATLTDDGWSAQKKELIEAVSNMTDEQLEALLPLIKMFKEKSQ